MFLCNESGVTATVIPGTPGFREENGNLHVGAIAHINQGAQTVTWEITNSLIPLPRNWREVWTAETIRDIPTGAHMYVDTERGEWKDVPYNQIDNEFAAVHRHVEAIRAGANPPPFEQDVDTGVITQPGHGGGQSDQQISDRQWRKHLKRADDNHDGEVDAQESIKYFQETGVSIPPGTKYDRGSND